jgi:hypothetical protein
MTLLSRFLSIAAAGTLALSFAATASAASTTAPAAANPGQSHTDHARFERVTTFQSSPAAGSSSSAFFSTDARMNSDLPKDGMPGPAAGSVPTATATQTETSGGSQATSAFGLNAADLSRTHGFVVEPPDQGLCAGNGYVLEAVNLNLKVFTQANFSGVGQTMALETFFGLPLAFGVTPGTDFTIQGDPKCYFDPATQRWFISQLDLDFSNNTSHIFLAVSHSSNPTGSYNIYSIDNTDLQNPGCPCFGDQPLLGANQDAIFFSTNEFSINANNFNGAVVYAVDKSALVRGAAAPNVFVDPVGLNTSTPEGACYNGTVNTGICWYSIQPATAPQGSSSGSVEYALSALDFFNRGDNRVAVWAFSNTGSIRTKPAIHVTESEVRTTTYIFPPFARQAPGTLPLQKCIQTSGCSLFSKPTMVPEGPIQTNDDRMNQTVFAAGLLWSGVNTAVNVNGHVQAGIAYFVVRPRFDDGSLDGSTTVNSGYVAPDGADVLFPSIGVTSTGKGILTFTLTGPNNYPSTGYTTIAAASGAGPVQVAVAGASPDDSFTEYQFFGTPNFRPRWGDYSAAVADGSTVFFAAEMIQYPNCPWSTFHKDPTCGGTRDGFANWGTSLSKITP